MAPAPSLINESGLISQPGKISAAPHDLNTPRQTLTPTYPQEKTNKTAIRTPQFLFRLENTPFLCFHSFTSSFNRTHVSVRTRIFPTRKRERNVAHVFGTAAVRSELAPGPEPAFEPKFPISGQQISNRESNREIEAGHRKDPTSEKKATTLPSILLRLKTTPILYFVRVTNDFNRTHVAIKANFYRTQVSTTQRVTVRRTGGLTRPSPTQKCQFKGEQRPAQERRPTRYCNA